MNQSGKQAGCQARRRLINELSGDMNVDRYSSTSDRAAPSRPVAYVCSRSPEPTPEAVGPDHGQTAALQHPIGLVGRHLLSPN